MAGVNNKKLLPKSYLAGVISPDDSRALSGELHRLFQIVEIIIAGIHGASQSKLKRGSVSVRKISLLVIVCCCLLYIITNKD
jgi:hypothetical protein